MADRRGRTSTRAQARQGPRPLAVLGGVTLVLGLVLSLSLFGVPRLLPLAELWRYLCGWFALPLALALTGVGAALLVRRDDDPWRLPWGRTLGIEIAVASALALLAGAFGPGASAPPPPAGSVEPGGLIGWALSAASARALGSITGTLAWFALGVLGLLAAFKVGAHQIAAALESAGDRLTEEMTPAPTGERLGDPAKADSAAATGPAAAATAPAPDPATAPGKQQPPSTAARAEPVASRPKPRASKPRVRDATRPGKTSGPRRVSGARHLPELDLLGDDRIGDVSDTTLTAMADTIERTLASFGVPVDVVEIERGPAVTRFGVAPGLVETGGARRRVKVSRITGLRSDLALALAAPTIRIEAPIPGRNLVGIEVPNPDMHTVGLKGLLSDPAFRRVSRRSGLAIALGRDVTGEVVVADLPGMPHLLVGGATGSGKSVCIDAVLASLLFQNSPDALRLVLIDPKRVELTRYNRLPHLQAAVVTDIQEVVGALRWVVREMDARYQRFAERRARDLAGYNAKTPAGEAPLPTLVVVIDELADLMLTAPVEVEPLLTRIAQLGRATGIHLVVATQRPSTDVITGIIKANFPARIAFAVASSIDSRVILDQTGAEALLGRGDMLFLSPDAGRLRRAQGAFVSDDELGRLVEFWLGSHWQGPGRVPPWDDLVTPLDPAESLYAAARAVAEENATVSASLLQRKLRIGYRKARELFDRLEDEGLVATATGTGTSTSTGTSTERGGPPREDIDAPGGGAPPGEDLNWVDDEFDPGA